jgi:hypothetical protein
MGVSVTVLFLTLFFQTNTTSSYACSHWLKLHERMSWWHVVITMVLRLALRLPYLQLSCKMHAGLWQWQPFGKWRPHAMLVLYSVRYIGGGSSVAEHLITLRKVVGSIPTLLAYQQWDTNPVLRGGSPGTEPLQRVMGRRKVGTGEPMTWVGCARPNQTPLVPSAPRCVWGGTTYKVMAYAQLAERTWQLFLFLYVYTRGRPLQAVPRTLSFSPPSLAVPVSAPLQRTQTTIHHSQNTVRDT